MSTTTKKLFIAGGVAALVAFAVMGAKKASAWAGQISVQLIDFFAPNISNGVFTLPVKLRINNPSPLFAPIQTASARMYMVQNNQYVQFGQAPPTPGFNINPHESTDVTLFPQINLAALNLFSGNNTWMNLLTVLANQNPLVQVRIDVSFTIAGITHTEQVFKEVYLKQLFKNVG